MNLLRRIPQELIDLSLMAAVFLGLALLGRSIQVALLGRALVGTYGVFALSGIAGACWGYWMGSRPMRNMYRDWYAETVEGYRAKQPRVIRETPDLRGGSRGTGPRW